MTKAPVDMRENLIVFGDDKKAAQIRQTLTALSEVTDGCIMGIISAVDDEAVHADHWERHPDGDEVLYLIDGRLAVTIDDGDGSETTRTLEQGHAFFVPKGSWHRLRVLEPGQLLFLTPVAGGDLRPVRVTE